MSDTHTSGPTGLGGWLVLVAIGLVLAPLRILAFLLQTFVPIFSDGTWTVLTTPGSEHYHPLWAPLLVFEVVVNLAFAFAGLWLLVLFSRRSQNFPRVYVWLALLNIPFIFVDAWLGSFVLTEEPVFDRATAGELARSIVGAAIWVPYMLSSRRVRNTFVVGRAAVQQPVPADRVG
jgi:hypothetical protein